MEPSRRDVLIVLVALSGCDKFFGLTGNERVDAASPVDAPALDGAPPPCGLTDGMPAYVAAAKWYYPSANLQSALRVNAAGAVQYAQSSTLTVERLADGDYADAFALPGGKTIEQPSLSADGSSYASIVVTGNDRLFGAGKRTSGTYPFAAPAQMHVYDGNTELLPTAADHVSPATSTSPRHMVLSLGVQQVVELEESVSKWSVVRKTLPSELGLVTVQSASLSADGLALTLVAAAPASGFLHVHRATRAQITDAFGPAVQIFTVPSLGFDNAYTTAGCDALVYRVGDDAYLVR